MFLRTMIVSVLTAAWALPVVGAGETSTSQGDDASLLDDDVTGTELTRSMRMKIA
jgi:hypothetical protein